MVEELLGPLPNGWTYLTLGDVCRASGGDVQTGPFGSQLHASDYVADGIPSIMPQNIGDNRIIEKGIARICASDAERLVRYRVREGDIIYSRRGDVERRSLIRKHEDGWLCGTGCLRVRFGAGGPNNEFSAHYLGHPAVREWIVRHAHGATMPNLNTSILSACPFVLPPHKEQEAIASILGALDDKIDLNRRLNETLEAMARAIYKDWFVDFGPTRAKTDGRPPYLAPDLWALFPDRLDEEGKPEGWETVTVEAVAERVGMGPFGSNIKVETFVDSGVPIISGQHLNGTLLEDNTHRFITEAHAGRMANSKVRQGDIVFTHAGNIGQVSIIPESSRYKEYILSQRQFYLRCDRGKVSPEFLIYFFRSPEGQHKLLANASQVGVPSIARPATNLRAIQFCLPNFRPVNAFTNLIQSLHEKFGANRQESETLVSLRNLLLPKLMSGEIRVREAERLLGAVA